MTKTVAVLVGAGFVALVIVIAILVRRGCSEPPPKIKVEITAPKDTQVFRTLPSESEKHLGNLSETPLTLKVKVDATIILRYKKHEQSFPPNTWENGKIVWKPKTPQPIPNPPPNVTVAVNAVPWAEVFIKLPGTDRFVKPPKKRSNVTPIRGGLKVPVGTTVKLEYDGRKKVFRYEAWKDSKTIWHDFSRP